MGRKLAKVASHHGGLGRGLRGPCWPAQPCRNCPPLRPDDLNPATDKTLGRQGVGGITVTLGTGKAGEGTGISTCCLFISPHLNSTKCLNRVTENWKMGEKKQD